MITRLKKKKSTALTTSLRPYIYTNALILIEFYLKGKMTEQFLLLRECSSLVSQKHYHPSDEGVIGETFAVNFNHNIGSLLAFVDILFILSS